MGGTFHVEVDGKNVTGALSVIKSKKARRWHVIGKSGVRLTAGNHVLRLRFDRAGSNGQVGNFDSLVVTRRAIKAAAAAAAAVAVPSPFATLAIRRDDRDDLLH